jgi:hypothetical protein
VNDDTMSWLRYLVGVKCPSRKRQRWKLLFIFERWPGESNDDAVYEEHSLVLRNE